MVRLSSPLEGRSFGRLTVIERRGSDSTRNALWYCECECGGSAVTRGFMLKSGRAQSCGCYHSEVVGPLSRKLRTTPDRKTCPSCGETKLANKFGLRGTSTDGLSSHCKHCKNVEYKRRNMAKTISNTTARKKYIRQATPPWADRVKIDRKYLQSEAKTLLTGDKHNVDHIIPLRGKNVCGLHVETNLRVITATDNMAKGNRI